MLMIADHRIRSILSNQARIIKRRLGLGRLSGFIRLDRCFDHARLGERGSDLLHSVDQFDGSG
jgi:hypothetical protein